MAKNFYSYEKRQQELKKQKKRQEKLKKKQERKKAKQEGIETPAAEADRYIDTPPETDGDLQE